MWEGLNVGGLVDDLILGEGVLNQLIKMQLHLALCPHKVATWKTNQRFVVRWWLTMIDGGK